MSRPGGAVTVRAARNASRPRATVPGTKPPGIRAREGHLRSATHSCVTYGPYVTQNRKEGPHMSTKSALRADLDAEDRKTQAEDRKPPSRDTANSAPSPIRSSASLELQVGGVAYRCPIEFRHQVARLEPGTLGRRLRVDLEDDCSGRPNPFWTLVPRRPSHPQPRPAAPSWPRARLPCAPLPAFWRASSS